MPRTTANVGRILLSVVALFVAWIAGGFLVDRVFPGTFLMYRMESVAGKAGSTLGVVVVAVILRRYLLRSFALALICLASTELVVLLIAFAITGLWSLAWSDVRYNLWWVYVFTWNVVVGFFIGAGIGHLWDHRAAINPVQRTRASARAADL